MPEGDTVYRLARRLDARLAGRYVVRSQVRVPRNATAELSGRCVLGTDTHGKHLLTRFEHGLTLHTHLRMDGSWTVVRAGRRLPSRLSPDIRVVLALDSGETAYGLSLPVVDLVRTEGEAVVVGHLGPDPLRADWDAERATANLVADPGRCLAAALLDQRVLAGLGNLWVNELCFVRGHSPWTSVGEVDAARVVLTAARMLRTSALGDGPVQVTTGDPRRGQRHWVTGRAHQPCRRCATPVRVADAVPGNPERRRTWWCPFCQPGPGPRP